MYTTSYDILPSQSVSLKEKLKISKDPSEKTWAQKTMDALESIGRNQYNLNLKLIENYEMIKGKFIFSHYFETDGYKGLLTKLSEEVELPSYLRHYDIISQVVNTMSGEWQKRPDTFKVRHVGDGATSEWMRKKVEMTQEYVMEKVNAKIDAKLAEQGIDVNKSNFNSEEEEKQYFDEINSERQKLTPIQIQKYLDTDFLTNSEIWANNHFEKAKEFFNVKEKEKIEFEDMLTADRAFRHFFISTNSFGYIQETWNPVNTFFHKSPDVVYIEDGDYVGRIFNLSINTIIDRYGHLLTREDFDLLQGKCKNNDKKWEDHKYNWVYDNHYVPFENYPEHNLLQQARAGLVPIPQLDDFTLNQLSSSSFYKENEGFYFVTEAYWKSQKKLIKITYFDYELKELVMDIVDETYEIPKHFRESKKVFDDEHDLDTYAITFVNEVWKGVKVNTAYDKDLQKDLYIDIRPNDFQFKGDLDLYGCKLPVCGQIFSTRNSGSMSVVDLMKPYQIAYNVSMNQVFNLMEKEIGMFVVMDVNMFPNSKDWGGSDSWEKWMLLAKNMGLVPADTNPANIKNSLAATGGFLPKVIDLNLASQMVSRMNLCKFFEEQALKQVGFNQYRVGAYTSSATATGIEQGTQTSYAQTESHFTNFSNYLRRVYQMDLDIAQYVESKKETIEILYNKSDLQKGFIKLLGSELLLSDLGLFVNNSQEHLRQIEMMRQYALQNNTSGMSPETVMDIITTKSPREIKRSLQKSYEEMMQQQQKNMDMQQQAIQAEQEAKQAELQEKARQFDELMQNNLDREYIKAGTEVINTVDPEIPVNDNGDLELKAQINSDNQLNNKERLNLDNEKIKLEHERKMAEIQVKQNKINADLIIQNQETESARILKGRKKK